MYEKVWIFMNIYEHIFEHPSSTEQAISQMNFVYSAGQSAAQSGQENPAPGNGSPVVYSPTSVIITSVCATFCALILSR